MMASIFDASGLHIHRQSSGFTAIYGPAIEAAASAALIELQRSPRRYEAFHVTLLTKDEARELGKTPKRQQTHLFPPSVIRDLHCLGLGRTSSRTEHLAVVCPSAARVRKKLGLPEREFHITLTGSGTEPGSRGFNSLLDANIPGNSSELTLVAMGKNELIHRRFDSAHRFAAKALDASSFTNADAWRLLASVGFHQRAYKLSMLAFARAIEVGVEGDDNAVKGPMQALLQCGEYTELGPLFVPAELRDEIQHQYHGERLIAELMRPWSQALRGRVEQEAAESGFEGFTIETQHRPMVPIGKGPTQNLHRLHRFFSWVVPFRLAASSTPKSAEDVVALSSPAAGISHIITLTAEEPLSPQFFHRSPYTKHTHLPIADQQAPTLADIDLFISLVASSSGPVLVHCGGGKGRAGTMLACYLVVFGRRPPPKDLNEWQHPSMSPRDAIAEVRRLRPGSIETRVQEQIVDAWSAHIWKRLFPIPPPTEEPSPSEPVVEGGLENLRRAELLVLVGLPGSGKTWFRQLLCARYPAYLSVSGDEDGGRSTVDTAVGRPLRGGKKLVVDRCNVSHASRRELLELASTGGAGKAAVVYFDYVPALCRSRASLRSGHPCIRPSAASRVVDEKHGQLEVPRLSEGFLAVAIVRSFAAAEHLLRTLAPLDNVFKFPRTKHLLNLGAATDDDLHGGFASPPFLANDRRIVITEKIDGANMGFSLSSNRALRVQNRSHWVCVSDHAQFAKLDGWTRQRREDLYRILDRDHAFPERYILFGEWLAAKHSIHYSGLPSLFVAYDLYDRRRHSFVSRVTLAALLEPTEIPLVPLITESTTMPTLQVLRRLATMTKSRFGAASGVVEGIYVKIENEEKVIDRGKVVRGDFIPGDEHWAKGNPVWNIVLSEIDNAL